MIYKSELNGMYYQEEDCVYFRNIQQSSFYVKNGCMPVDMFTDGNDKLVLVFKREEHNKLIKLWMENKKESENIGE